MADQKKIIIGIIGANAAGKTTATEYLKQKYGAVSFRFSDVLSDILRRLYLGTSRANFQTLSTILRQNFSEDILSKVVAEDVKNSPAGLIITEGVRRPTDVTYLKKLPNFYLVSLNAGERTRYERLLKRQEKPDDAAKTWEKFQTESQQEAEQKIRAIAAQADFQIDNSGTEERMRQQIDDILRKILHES